MLVGIVLFIGFVFVLISYWDKKNSSLKKAPGPPCFPLIGSIPYLIPYAGRTQEFTKDMCRKYGPIFGFQFGSQYFAFTEDHELVQHILSSEEWINRLNEHPMHYERSFDKSLGLLLGKSEIWKEIRQFTIRSLRMFGFGKGSMEDSIDMEVQDMLQRLEESIDKRGGSGIQFMQKFFQIPSTNVLWSMVAGFRFSYDDKKLKQILQLADTFSKEFRLGYSPMYAYPFLRFIPGLTERKIMLDLHTQIQGVIREIMEEKKNSGLYKEEATDVIESYLKEIETRKKNGSYSNEKNVFTEEQVLMVGTDLFITGIDSTSTALEFAILYMILFQDVQKKIQEEIDEVVGTERCPTLADKLKMPYTEAATLEILRFASNLPLTMRSPSHDTELNGYFIPKGSLVGLNLQAIHYSEKIWSDPNTFRPERFLDRNRNVINSDKIMPFGYGKRVCMGEVLARSSFFKFFTSLLQKYSFQPSPLHPPPEMKAVFGFNQFPQRYYALMTVRKGK